MVSPSLAVLDQVGPPVDERGARDVAAGMDRRPLPSGRQRSVEDADPVRLEILGQPLGRGQDLRAGQATHRRYHTAVVVPFLPDPEKLAAVREAIPALGAGIYLNTGSVGPLPAETAAAMAEHGGLRARRRAGARRLLRRDSWRGWPRRAPASRPSSARTSPAVALTHSDDRRDERRDAPARLAARAAGR